MLMSWKLGRFAGIDVFLHPTFLLIFMMPHVNGIETIAVVLAAFFCVLLHEFGHALMARRFGIETQDITLYPIGGIARLQRLPKAPGAEILIALAGPAVNVAIAAGLVLVMRSGVLGSLGEGATAAWFAYNLFAVNLMLAGFNLIPAFPMDGGRVLRAVLSSWFGRVRATSIAAGLGQALAMLFGVYCLINGLWLQAFLAAFIYMAAAAERARVVAEESRNRRDRDRDDDRFDGDTRGIWMAPPGFEWVRRGEGVWQLAPVYVDGRVRSAPRWR